MPRSVLNPGQVPVLETPRLRLRAHTAMDFAASCALWADAEVVRHTLGRPATPEEVWSRLLRYLGSWSLLGYGYWVVEEKQSGVFVGEVGLSNLHRDIAPPIGDIPEIGWVLRPDHHGKGYATEAAQAVLDWVCEPPLSAARIACIINTENQPSIRVAEKLGFRASYTTTYRGEPTLVLYATSGSNGSSFQAARD